MDWSNYECDGQITLEEYLETDANLQADHEENSPEYDSKDMVMET